MIDQLTAVYSTVVNMKFCKKQSLFYYGIPAPLCRQKPKMLAVCFEGNESSGFSTYVECLSKSTATAGGIHTRTPGELFKATGLMLLLLIAVCLAVFCIVCSHTFVVALSLLFKKIFMRSFDQQYPSTLIPMVHDLLREDKVWQ
jgi:hypothetical protein